MSEYEITMAIRRKVPLQTGGVKSLVCDNGDYTLRIDGDEEWAEHGIKTVLFVLPGGAGTVTVLTEEDVCRIPVITKPGTLRIGVTAGEELRTTREMEIPVTRSIRTVAGEEVPQVPPDVTQQIITRLDKLERVQIEYDPETGDMTIRLPSGTVDYDPGTGNLTIGE